MFVVSKILDSGYLIIGTQKMRFMRIEHTDAKTNQYLEQAVYG